MAEIEVPVPLSLLREAADVAKWQSKGLLDWLATPAGKDAPRDVRSAATRDALRLDRVARELRQAAGS